MAFISEEEINNIRNEANIVDIVASYIPLNKSGSDYVGICPFHEDHSPSMHVSTKKNIFKCFVCNTSGNVFSFVQKYEGVSFPEAVKIVAQKSGISFNHEITRGSGDRFKNEFALMDLSLKYYQNNLASQAGVDAKKYLEGRGITENIIKDFKFGLSEANNSLKTFLERKSMDLELAHQLGLLNKNGIEYYDTFLNRIMIPIFDMQGNLAGYTARAYLKDEKNKYINSKETIIYKKSNILFNYYNAKEIARYNKEMIVVEGNMDAITLASHGIKNVVALMGVVISKEQIEALRKIGGKTILMLDSDSAGTDATMKVGEQLYKSGIDTYVVRLTGAKDPDEYIRKFSVEKLNDNIKHAKKYLDFKLDFLKENKNLNNYEELTLYIKEVLASLTDAGELEREIALAKICKDYNLDINILKKELTPVKKEAVNVIKKKPKLKKTRYTLASYAMLNAMLLNKDYYRIYMNELGYLRNKAERDMAFLIGSYIDKYGNVDISGFIDYVIQHDEVSLLLNEILTSSREEDVTEDEFYDIVRAVANCIDEEDIKELKLKIKEEKDIARKVELIAKLTELKKGCGNNEGN